jgi:catechol 2,3-dioxygenase
MNLQSKMKRPIWARLYELELNSDDPARLADFYGKALGYHFVQSHDVLVGTALDRRLRIKAGAPRTLGHAAYAVDDADELRALERRLSRADVEFDHVDLDGFEPGALSFEDPDGNHFLFGVAAPANGLSDVTGAQRPARIQHVVFASVDPQRLLAFFTDVVGFVLSDVVLDDERGLRTAFVRCSREHHSLAFFAAKENRLDHHCYEAGDWNLIRDWADHFASQRLPLKWGPGRHGPGNNLFLFVHDPDGNWVEISAELEHVEAGRPAGEWPHEEFTLNTWGMGLLRS